MAGLVLSYVAIGLAIVGLVSSVTTVLQIRSWGAILLGALIGAGVPMGLLIWLAAGLCADGGCDFSFTAVGGTAGVGALVGGATGTCVAFRGAKVCGAVERRVLSTSSPAAFTLGLDPVGNIAVFLNGRRLIQGREFLRSERTISLCHVAPTEGDELIIEYDYVSAS
jgi:hypothetical protein